MSKKGDFENHDFSDSAVFWGPKNRTNRGIPVLQKVEIMETGDGDICDPDTFFKPIT